MMYVARTQFGMSARELWHETPEWEVDALFAELKHEQKEIRRANDR